MRCSRFTTCVLLTWAALAQAAFAQEPEAAPVVAKPAEPTELTESNFGLLAAKAEELTTTVGRELDAETVSSDVEATLDAIETEAAGLLERTASLSTRRMMNSELNALDAELDLLEARTNRQIDKVASRAKRLAELGAEVERSIELWTDGVRRARDPSVPKEVRTRTVRVLRELRSARTRILSKQGGYLALQSRGLDVLEKVDAAHRAVEVAQAEAARNVFDRQDPPLWKRAPAAPKDEDAAVRDSYDIAFSWPAVTTYLRQSTSSMVLQLLLVLALGLMFSRLRRALRERIDNRQQDGPIPWEDRAIEALAHPWAAAVFVGFASMRLFHPERAADLILASWLIAIPIWFVVFREMLPRSLHAPLLGLAALGTLHVVLLATSGPPIVERALLLMELLLAGTGAFWLSRFLRRVDVPKRLGQSFWFSAALGWTRAMAIVSAVGTVATVLGYRYLGEEAALVVTIGSIGASYFLALARIFEAWISTEIHIGRLDWSRMIRANRDVVSNTLTRIVRILLVLWFVLSLSDMTSSWRALANAVRNLLETDLGLGLAETGVTLLDLLDFFFILWVSWIIARAVSFLLMQEILPRLHMQAGVPYALTTFTRYAIIAIGFVAALAVLGLSLDKVTIVLSALGVGIGFGLQNLVNNFVSGFVLLTERPIRLRDKVEVNGVLGNVTSIGIRASTIRTFDGAEVIVPNGDLVSNQLVNWTLAARQQRITIPVGVAYGTDPTEVLKILRRVAANNKDVFTDPAPLALFRGFGESSLDFELRVFMDPSNVLDVPSALHVEIYEALKEANITIPFPQRDVHFFSDSTPQADREPVDDAVQREDTNDGQ
jgi:small-conductance mechanosensitive channel